MDPDVIHDPVFQQLLLKYELESRKLRDAVIAMRSFYLTHHKGPQEETISEQWRGAILGEEACLRHGNVETAASDLLRYAFEIAPTNNDALHLEELYKLKMSHRGRLERRTGWGGHTKPAAGIEERVRIDDGPPITWIINPKNYEFTEKARKRRRPAEPAITPDESQHPGEPTDDVDSVE